MVESGGTILGEVRAPSLAARAAEQHCSRHRYATAHAAAHRSRHRSRHAREGLAVQSEPVRRRQVRRAKPAKLAMLADIVHSLWPACTARDPCVVTPPNPSAASRVSHRCIARRVPLQVRPSSEAFRGGRGDLQPAHLRAHPLRRGARRAAAHDVRCLSRVLSRDAHLRHARPLFAGSGSPSRTCDQYRGNDERANAAANARPLFAGSRSRGRPRAPSRTR